MPLLAKGRSASYDIDTAEVERAEMELLADNLKQIEGVSQQINGILSNFDGRMHKLEHSIAPVFDTTQKLTTFSKNIDATLESIDKSKSLYDIVPKEEQIIKRGPEEDLEQYLQSVGRLSNSLQRLQDSSFESSDKIRNQMTQLLKAAALNLNELTRKILADEQIMSDISSVVAHKKPFPTMSSRNIQQLRHIAAAFKKALRNIDVDNSIVLRTIESRSEYLTSNLEIAAPQSKLRSINGPPSSVSVASSTRQDKNAFNHYTSALIGLIDTETDHFRRIFGKDEGLDLMPALTKAVVKMYCSTANALRNHCAENMDTESLLLYSMIGDLKRACGLSPLVRSSPNEDTINDTWKATQKQGENSFKEFFAHVKMLVTQLTLISQDAHVEPITIETVNRLVQIADEAEESKKILANVNIGSWGRVNSNVGGPQSPQMSEKDPSATLSAYLSEVIQALFLGLESKANLQLKASKLVHGAFLLNNLDRIRRTVERTSLYDLIGMDARSMFDMYHKRSMKIFNEPWNGLATTIMQMDTKRTGSSSLSSSDKSRVKKMFTTWNETLESLAQQMKTLSIESKDLKNQMIDEIKRVVIPVYRSSRDSGFSKNTDKYIKFPNDTQLENYLLNIFAK